MRTPKDYGKRYDAGEDKLEPKIRYFIAFEGEKTEYEYFKGVIKNQRDLEISDLIEITPLLRHYDHKNWSNPEVVCNLLIADMRRRCKDDVILDELIRSITDYIKHSLGSPKKIDITKHLTEKLSECGYSLEFSVSADKDGITNCICNAISELQTVKISEKSIARFKEYLREQKQFSKRDGDVVCIIADRDSESFTEAQYRSVMAKCRKENFNLYVTNPRFEFWLLLHFMTKNDIDAAKLLLPANPGEQPYLEMMLSKHLHGFSKRTVPFEQLIDKTDDAIRNEKEFCEDAGKLNSCIGSNIGKLLTEMRRNGKYS